MNFEDSKKQEAHIRAVLHHNGKYQCLLFADLQGFDLYTGPGGFKNALRSSWHQSGKTHIHTPIGRIIGLQKQLPSNFTGKELLYSGGHCGTEWNYKLKKDTSHRRTVVIDQAKVLTAIMIDLWVIQFGQDVVNEILLEYTNKSPLFKSLGYVVSDWTNPQLLLVVNTIQVK